MLRIHARKVDGEAPLLRVYASTVVPVSLVACLESQLQAMLAATLHGTPYDVDYLLRTLVQPRRDEVVATDEIVGLMPVDEP